MYWDGWIAIRGDVQNANCTKRVEYGEFNYLKNAMFAARSQHDVQWRIWLVQDCTACVQFWIKK